MMKIAYWKHAAAVAALLLAACAPKFDWREVRGADAAYTVLMPAKPVSQTRNVALSAGPSAMTMSVATVDGVDYAVGSAEFPDPAQAQAALAQFEAALVKNIQGTVLKRRTTVIMVGSGPEPKRVPAVVIEAAGVADPKASAPQAMMLLARFVAHERRAYQVVVLGPANAILREPVDTFLGSFKLN